MTNHLDNNNNSQMDTYNDSTVYGNSSDEEDSKMVETNQVPIDVSKLVRDLPQQQPENSQQNIGQNNPNLATTGNLGISGNYLKPIDELTTSKPGPSILDTQTREFLQTGIRKKLFGPRKNPPTQQQVSQEQQLYVQNYVYQQPTYDKQPPPTNNNRFQTPQNQKTYNIYSHTNLKYSNAPQMHSPDDVSMRGTTPPKNDTFITPNPSNTKPNLNTQQF